jgi:hypothetical protein
MDNITTKIQVFTYLILHIFNEEFTKIIHFSIYFLEDIILLHIELIVFYNEKTAVSSCKERKIHICVQLLIIFYCFLYYFGRFCNEKCFLEGYISSPLKNLGNNNNYLPRIQKSITFHVERQNNFYI